MQFSVFLRPGRDAWTKRVANDNFFARAGFEGRAQPFENFEFQGGVASLNLFSRSLLVRARGVVEWRPRRDEDHVSRQEFQSILLCFVAKKHPHVLRRVQNASTISVSVVGEELGRLNYRQAVPDLVDLRRKPALSEVSFFGVVEPREESRSWVAASLRWSL